MHYAAKWLLTVSFYAFLLCNSLFAGDNKQLSSLGVAAATAVGALRSYVPKGISSDWRSGITSISSLFTTRSGGDGSEMNQEQVIKSKLPRLEEVLRPEDELPYYKEPLKPEYESPQPKEFLRPEDELPFFSAQKVKDVMNNPKKLIQLFGSLDPQSADEQRRTPLMYATLFAIKPNADFVPIVQQQLNNGAQVNHQDEHKKTALMYAVSTKGNTALLNSITQQLIDAFVDAGADLNLQDAQGKTALALAAERQNEAAVRSLLAKGANPNIVTQSGMSPLMLNAVTAHDPTIIQLLVEAGADGNLQDKTGSTALMYAAENLQSFSKTDATDPIIGILVEEATTDIGLKDTNGRTAIDRMPTKMQHPRIVRRYNYLRDKYAQQQLERGGSQGK